MEFGGGGVRGRIGERIEVEELSRGGLILVSLLLFVFGRGLLVGEAFVEVLELGAEFGSIEIGG